MIANKKKGEVKSIPRISVKNIDVGDLAVVHPI